MEYRFLTGGAPRHPDANRNVLIALSHESREHFAGQLVERTRITEHRRHADQEVQ